MVLLLISKQKKRKTPKQIIDYYDQIIRKSFNDFGISFDNYSRTSSKIHHKTASEIFIKLHEKKKFSIKETEQLFDPEVKSFLLIDL